MLSVLYCLPLVNNIAGYIQMNWNCVVGRRQKGGGGWERILSVFNKLGYHRVDFFISIAVIKLKFWIF